MEYGFNAYLLGNDAPGAAAFNNRALGLVREAGFGWVRLQLVWRDFERGRGDYDWASLDARIEAATASGAKVLISVVRAPAWAAPSRPGGLPEDLAAFHTTMQALTGHYRGQVRAYEIWNEPNLASEVGGRVDVGAYYDTLKTAFEAVKEVDQSAIVVFGGLLPTTLNDPAVAVDDVEYLRQFYAHSTAAGQYYDVLAVHPFGAANPPEALYPDQPGPGACPARYAAQQGSCYRDSRAYYFRRVEDEHALLERVGDRKKQVWLTEFGWDACQGLPAPAGYEYCALVSERQQADYTVRAFEYANRNWPWLGVMFLWNLNYAAIPGIAPSDEKYGWSVLRADGSARPVFDAVKSMPKLPILPPECLFPSC
jgi:hypothetical protein